MIAFPNAKINLGLNIISKRSDGYHDIESVFYPLPLKDVLEIVPASSTEIFLYNSTEKIPLHKNICYKAWSLLHQKYSIEPVHIFLHKNIPSGAGLGGGSSDAAYTLKMLNKIFNLNLSNEELLKLALLLGSDCPFFLLNKACIATGRGESLNPISLNLKNYTIVLVNPNIHISTQEAYSLITPKKPTINTTEIVSKPIETWKENLENDFEQPIFAKYPILSNIKQQLYNKGALYASMSGSGSTIFGIFKKPLQDLSQLFNFENYFVWQGDLTNME